MEKDKELKPYSLELIKYGITKRVKVKSIYASSRESARRVFLKFYPYLMDYLNLGYNLEARLDVEMLNKSKRKKENQEEFLQNKAWWNK